MLHLPRLWRDSKTGCVSRGWQFDQLSMESHGPTASSTSIPISTQALYTTTPEPSVAVEGGSGAAESSVAACMSSVIPGLSTSAASANSATISSMSTLLSAQSSDAASHGLSKAADGGTAAGASFLGLILTGYVVHRYCKSNKSAGNPSADKTRAPAEGHPPVRPPLEPSTYSYFKARATESASTMAIEYITRCSTTAQSIQEMRMSSFP